MAASTVVSFHGWPMRAASVALARAGVAAMPPKAMRAWPTRPAARVRAKAPHRAEMSWSWRFETFQQRKIRPGGAGGSSMASMNSPGARVVCR